MPIYEFRCKDCQHRFSEFFRHMHNSNERSAPPCPNCHSTDTLRVVSGFVAHGSSGPDAGELATQRAEAERKASITPRSQIDQWRSGRD